MRVAVVVLATLVVAPAAWAHAEVSPTSIHVSTATELTLQVPTESEIASTVEVTVTAPLGVELQGRTRWTGRTKGVVQLTFTARAEKLGDYVLRVRQVYSGGRTVNWAPALRVEGASTANRDRLLILIAVAVVAAVLFALRGRSRQRPE